MSRSAKAWFLLIAVFSLLLLGGHWLGGREGLLWALIISLGINSFIYFYSDQKIISLFKGQKLEGQDPWRVLNITHKLALKTRIPMPQIFLLPNSAPQAMCFGRSQKHSSIILTQGLLSDLSEEELEAVIAYLVAAIQQSNTFVYNVASALTGVLLKLSLLFDRTFRWIFGLKNTSHSPHGHPFTMLIGPLLSLILKLAVGGENYFETDQLAAKLLENPKKMAEVLWKLESFAKTTPFETPAFLAHMFIVNPLIPRGWCRYFQTQPMVEDRIKKLLGYYPI